MPDFSGVGRSRFFPRIMKSSAPRMEPRSGRLTENLPSVPVHLKNAERVSLVIQEVALPASIRHGELRQRDHSPDFLDRLRSGIEVFDFERTNESIRAALR